MTCKAHITSKHPTKSHIVKRHRLIIKNGLLINWSAKCWWLSLEVEYASDSLLSKMGQPRSFLNKNLLINVYYRHLAHERGMGYPDIGWSRVSICPVQWIFVYASFPGVIINSPPFTLVSVLVQIIKYIFTELYTYLVFHKGQDN